MPVIDYGSGVNQNRSFVLRENWLGASTTTVTASSQAVGYEAVNIADPSTYNAWRGVTAPATATYDFGVARPFNTLGVAWQTAGAAGAEIVLQYSSDGSSWQEVFSHIPNTNGSFIFTFPSITARYARIVQRGAIYSLGSCMLGRRTLFPCTPVDSYTPTFHARTYKKLFNTSIQGQFLGQRVIASGGTTEVTFPLLSRDWVDGTLTAFQDHYSRGGTFFYAGWPGGKPNDMAYCRAPSEDAIVDIQYVQAEKLASVSFGIEMFAVI